MNNRILPIITLILVLSSVFFTGCGTVTRGYTETVEVTSEPPGANVALSNGQTGVTPTSFEIPRRNAVTVTFEKPGYEPQSIYVSSEISKGGGASMAGNILIGGVIGAAVDGASGSMYSHFPNPVHAVLVSSNPGEPVTTTRATSLYLGDDIVGSVPSGVTLYPTETNDHYYYVTYKMSDGKIIEGWLPKADTQ